jgi:hypothetical protein
MKKLIIPIVLFVLVLAGGYAVSQYRESEVTLTSENAGARGEPDFIWTYGTFEINDIPRTTISLTARYANGEIVTKDIETVDGSCNDYSNPDADVYVRSTMIICYYAGLGHYYKVVESDGKYEVQRKIFEEASPDYEPPQLPFEVVAQF